MQHSRNATPAALREQVSRRAIDQRATARWSPTCAINVTGGIVPDSGHWIMEENPQATIKLVSDFLRK